MVHVTGVMPTGNSDPEAGLQAVSYVFGGRFGFPGARSAFTSYVTTVPAGELACTVIGGGSVQTT